MTVHPCQLYRQSIDKTRNMERYCALSIQPTLFGEIAVVRCRGRIGRAGGDKSELFDNEQDAMAHFLAIARRKRAKGYKKVSNCGNPAFSAIFAATHQ